MHLIRLELYGFKSFANRTEFSFSPGITTLVGPNGCGKSNVVDAIRWVLGEQNPRALRANKMTDLIYGGTENSDQKNYAEVAVVLDNGDGEIALDFREVTIARRYYRSGESEYFLNGISCRLKDISALLAGTSLGKGTYSIIGQGQVAEVISSRPEDRRLMLEEAAGIGLYKLRKNEAEKKLGDTEGHITRIDDIIAELEGQAEDLRASAAKAETYLELKAQGDELELSLWAARYSDLKRRLDELGERQAALRTDKQQQTLALAEMEAQLVETAAAVEECQQVIFALDTNRSQLSASKTQHEYELELSRQRQGDLTSLIHSARQRLSALNVQLEEQKLSAAGLRQTLTECWQRFEQYSLAQEKRGRGAALLRRLLAGAEHYHGRAEADYLHGAQSNTEYSVGKEKAQALVAELAAQLATAQQEQTNRKAERRETEQTLANLGSARRQAAQEIEALSCQTAELTAQLQAATARWQQQADALREKEQAAQALAQRLSIIGTMAEELQGYSPGARAALKAAEAGRLPGIIGILGELVQARDPRHSLALETALGGALQYVVCATDATCRRAISLLKADKSGRATFIPLTAAATLAAKGERPDYGRQALGWADRLVDCSDQVRPAVEMLLSNVLLTDSLDSASQLAQKTRYRHRVVTLAGEVVGRGLYTGGSSSQAKVGPLQRKAQAQGIQAELTALSQRIAAQNQSRQQAAAEKDLLAEELARVTGSLAERDKEHIRLEAQFGQVELASLQAVEREQQSQGHITGLETRLTLAQQELARFSSLLAGDRESLAKLEGLGRRLGDCEQQLKDAVSLWSARQNSVQLAVYSWQNRGENLERQLKSLAGRAEETEKSRAELQTEIDSRERQQREMEAGLAESRQALAEIHAGLEAVGANLAGRVLARDNMQGELKGIERNLAIRRQEIAAAAGELHDLELKSTRWQTEAESMAAQLAAQFGLEPEAGLSHLDNRFSPAQLANRAKTTAEEIAQLGDVNLAAIKQHEKLSDRLSFLLKQRGDLAQASQDINVLLAELDETIRSLFLATFTEVQGHFARIFKILFAGGSAYLALSNDDPLETGIEVFARPAGKRTQSLTLLSGGEMALTAIALLFALQSVRPSPFCILDEIEAALDDTNILRFTQYLRQLARDRQFILITHRRETMEHSDSLYGITLNDEGASQPISIALNHYGQKQGADSHGHS